MAEITPTPPPADAELTIGTLFTVGWRRFLAIKLTTHALAGAAAFLGAMWASDEAFRDQVMSVFHAMPHGLQAALTAGVMIWAFYKKTHTTAK